LVTKGAWLAASTAWAGIGALDATRQHAVAAILIYRRTDVVT